MIKKSDTQNTKAESTRVKSNTRKESTYSYLSPVFQPSMTLVHGVDEEVYDDKGNKYLDFTGGIAVNAFGHRKDIVPLAVEKQLYKLIHVSNLFATEPQLTLCKKLVKIANRCIKGVEYSSVFLTNSGTEANECALKFVRLASKRLYSSNANKYEIVACKNSFHGRTMGALSVTGQRKYQNDFTPLIPGVKFIDFNSVEQLQNTVNRNTSAVILEIIQGEGGLSILSNNFAHAVNELSKKYNFYVIVDEVQTGMHRTGPFFASQLVGLKPHLITMSKALGGGLPIGAVITSKEIHRVLKVGDHGSTLAGNPISCVSALAVLRKMQSLGFRVQHFSSYTALKNGLQIIEHKYPQLRHVGKGHLRGITLDSSTGVGSIIEDAKKKKLLILRTGENTIRIAPSLICPPHKIQRGINILLKILKTHYLKKTS